MKDVWIVETKMMNGTVCVMSVKDIFATEELANEAAEKIKEANKGRDEFPILTTVEKVTLYETREDVPILNNEKAEI